MSVRGSAAALRRADEALREALGALTKVSVTEHLLAGVEVRPAIWHHRKGGLSVSISLDPREWPEYVNRRGWITDPSNGRPWTSCTTGRQPLGADLTPEQRAYERTDAEMREDVLAQVVQVLTELGQQRVEQAVAMLAREAVEAAR